MMDSESRDYVLVEIQCPKCREKAYYAVRLNTTTGKYDLYVCDNNHQTRIPVKGE